LIGEAEYTLIASGEQAVANQPGADVGGLEQIVEFEKTTNRQQRYQAPEGGNGGQPIDAGGNFGGTYRVDAITGRGGRSVSSHKLIHFLLMEKLSLLSVFADCECQRFTRLNC